LYGVNGNQTREAIQILGSKKGDNFLAGLGLAYTQVVQSYEEDYQVDSWRLGFGVIYSFARGEE
jgi:hypothetical protein